jgi:hypothetical protein
MYCDKHLKAKLWSEVCESVVMNWGELPASFGTWSRKLWHRFADVSGELDSAVLLCKYLSTVRSTYIRPWRRQIIIRPHGVTAQSTVNLKDLICIVRMIRTVSTYDLVQRACCVVRCKLELWLQARNVSFNIKHRATEASNWLPV